MNHPTTQKNPAMESLDVHATRLLLGTGLTPADARHTAAGITPASTAAEHALRDGWTATDRATLPPPPAATEGES